MKNISWKLLGLVGLLGLATYVVLRQPGETSTSGGGEVLVDYDSSSVDRIEISSSGAHIVLSKDGAEWMVTEPLKYRADQKAVAEALGKGRHLEIASPVSTNPGKQQLFQVDSSGTLVKISDRGNEKAAIRIGKTGSTYSDTYIRREGSNNVYLTNGILSSIFVRNIREWRDKTVFKTEKEFIKEVRFQYGDTTFALALKDSAWTIGGEKTLESIVNSFVSALTNFSADEFIDTSVSALPPLRAVLDVGGTQVLFYLLKDGTKYIVKSSQSPQLFEVQKWRADQVLKKKADFLQNPTKQ